METPFNPQYVVITLIIVVAAYRYIATEIYLQKCWSLEEIQLRDYPFFGPILAVIAFSTSLAFVKLDDPTLEDIGWMLLFFALGIVALLTSTILTCELDRNARTITLKYLGIIRKESTQWHADDIKQVWLSKSSSSKGNQTNYRVELILQNDDSVPLRKSYSNSRKWGHWRRLIEDALQITTEASGRKKRFSPTTTEEPVTTDNVTWQFEYYQSSARHWVSTNLMLGGDYLLLIQKPTDNKISDESSSESQWLSKFKKGGFKMYLTSIGIDPSEVDNLANAQNPPNLSTDLTRSFTVFTSDLDPANTILTTKTQQALTDWAEKHPIKKIQSSTSAALLTVLVNRKGLRLAVLEPTGDDVPQQLIDLGIQIVLAQAS